MNKFIRAAILAFALIAGFSPAFAQAPPPVPALPDAERRTSYVIAATTCICNVNFALYGDSTDYAAWVEVYLNGVRVNFNDGTFGWTITSPTGALGSIPRPVTDAVLTFNGVQTGTVQIVGARRPRRTSTFAENRGVAARDLNQILNDMIAQNRELWDKTNDITGRALISQPGVTLSLLPLPATCAGKFLGFDVTGLIPQCSAGGAGSGNVVGPGSSTVGHFATFNNTTGTLLADHVIQPSDLPSDAGTWRTVTANDTVLTTDCWKTIGLGGNALFTETLPVVAGFPAGCEVTVKNTDTYTGPGTARGKLLSGWPTDITPPGLPAITLYPGEKVKAKIVNGAWVTMLSTGRWVNPQQVTLCVDTTGSDSTGDGLVALATAGATCLRQINTAGSIIQKRFDINQTTPIIAPKVGQSFTDQLSLGGQPTGANLIQLSPNGSGNVNWSNAGPCITFGDNAELDLRLNGINAGGNISFTCNTANAVDTGHIYLHNAGVLDLEGGPPVFNGAGANDNAIFFDGKGIGTISDGIVVSGTFAYAGRLNQGGKLTWSGTANPNIGISGAPTLAGLWNLSGASELILGALAPTSAGYSSLGPTLVSTNSILINNGLAIPGGTITPTTGGLNCTTVTACVDGSLRGTTTNDNAPSGYIGEYISTGSANSTATITVTIASPAVVTWTAHGFVNSPIDGNVCTPVNFTTTGALPTGIVAGSTFYIIGSTITTNTFQIASSVANCIAGTAVNTSGGQSGVHTGINNAVIATGVAKDITGMSLTAGDWDVCGLISSNVAGGTVISLFYGYVTTTSTVNAAVPNNGAVNVFQTTFTAGGNAAQPIGCRRYSLASTTTIFLGTLMNFSSTNAAYGFIWARRMR